MTAQPLKIVHTESSTGWGGQEMRILSETQGLIARGNDVRIICCSNSALHVEAKRRGIPSIALPIGRKTLRGLFALRTWLKHNRVDVVNTHSSTDSWLVALACRLLQRPPALVRTRHVSVPLSRRLATRWLYRQADHIVTTGDMLAQQVIAVGCDPQCVTSIPTGHDTGLFLPGNKARARGELGIDENATVIGIVATLRSWKGHSFLIQALAQLTQRDSRLLIVGDGPQRAHLERQAQELNLADRIIFAGNRNNVIPWLHAMDIFVLPSYAHEGVPQALVQAMLCRLPIITTAVGAIPEAVWPGHSAILVEPRNVEALATAIGKLIDDPVLADSLSSNARLDAERRYGLTTMLDRMENVLHSAIACRASPHASK